MIPHLARRFIESMRRLGVGSTIEDEEIRNYYADLEVRYTDPARHYHSIMRVIGLLLRFEAFRSNAQNPDLIDVAIFYHDAICVPGAKDNEERSAALWSQHAHALCIPDDVVAEVAKYILATKTHQADPEYSPNLCLFLDMDLLPLAARPVSYDNDVSRIRDEYHAYTDEEFAFRRCEWISVMLDRKSIFNTEIARSRYESRARANLMEELSRLNRS